MNTKSTNDTSEPEVGEDQPFGFQASGECARHASSAVSFGKRLSLYTQLRFKCRSNENNADLIGIIKRGLMNKPVRASGDVRHVLAVAGISQMYEEAAGPRRGNDV
jgi:hypothetical protein